ncbi:MAG: hypothetical protein ISP90_07380 [Nevskia sp.]|nr:hypothetical protein [Nevskia sp.]
MPRQLTNEAELLNLLRAKAENFYEPRIGRRASAYMPKSLRAFPDAGDHECNWDLGGLEGVPPAIANFLRDEAGRLQQAHNVRVKH